MESKLLLRQLFFLQQKGHYIVWALHITEKQPCLPSSECKLMETNELHTNMAARCLDFSSGLCVKLRAENITPLTSKEKHNIDCSGVRYGVAHSSFMPVILLCPGC